MIYSQEVETYLDYCRYQKKLDKKTIRAYEMDLKQFALELDVERVKSIDRERLNHYITIIHNSYAPKTVKRKIASVRAFLNYMEDEEKIENNPIHKVKTKFKDEVILPRIIPERIIEQLLKKLYQQLEEKRDTEWKQKLVLRDLAVIEMLFSTGLRISELCQLRKERFDLQSGLLCIQGKGARERYVQVGSSEALRILNAYHRCFQEKIEKSGYFFINRYGKNFSDQSARKMIHRHVCDLNLDINITPHMFRHSFATCLMEADVNIRYIQKLLGHSSIVTTQIYTYVAMEKEREILRTKHPRNRMHMINSEKYDCQEIQGFV